MSISIAELATSEVTAPGVGNILARSPWQLAWARLRTDRVAVASMLTLVLLFLFAIGAPLVAHLTGHPADSPNLDTGTDDNGQAFPPGTNGYLFGTDNLGRDVLVRLAYGARVSLFVGVLTTLIATVVGVVVGLVAGYFGGWADGMLSRFTDIVLSFPGLLLAIALVAVYGPSITIAVGMIVFFSFAAIARVVRGQALGQREKEYVEAARSLGAGHLRIMFIDILPNLVAPVIVLASMLVPVAIVYEASLSFLGLGITPPSPSWGNMLSDGAFVAGYQVWWLWLFPSVALLLTTLAFNLLGDALRDALDPRTERIFAARRRIKAKD